MKTENDGKYHVERPPPLLPKKQETLSFTTRKKERGSWNYGLRDHKTVLGNKWR